MRLHDSTRSQPIGVLRQLSKSEFAMLKAVWVKTNASATHRNSLLKGGDFDTMLR